MTWLITVDMLLHHSWRVTQSADTSLMMFIISVCSRDFTQAEAGRINNMYDSATDLSEVIVSYVKTLVQFLTNKGRNVSLRADFCCSSLKSQDLCKKIHQVSE